MLGLDWSGLWPSPGLLARRMCRTYPLPFVPSSCICWDSVEWWGYQGFFPVPGPSSLPHCHHLPLFPPFFFFQNPKGTLNFSTSLHWGLGGELGVCLGVLGAEPHCSLRVERQARADSACPLVPGTGAQLLGWSCLRLLSLVLWFSAESKDAVLK